MTRSNENLKAQDTETLTASYITKVEKWCRLNERSRPAEHVDPRPYLAELRARGQDVVKSLLPLLQHPDPPVRVRVAIDLIESDVALAEARTVLWEMARGYGGASINASFYLLEHDREYQIKHRVPIPSPTDDPMPEGASRLWDQANPKLDSARLGKRPMEEN
ncbi:MAG: hypothetical protein JNL04_19140 [Rhodospirillaceae bacterium]|nr:hypothetical protein [Rhodospirillaceae bacterium]